MSKQTAFKFLIVGTSLFIIGVISVWYYKIDKGRQNTGENVNKKTQEISQAQVNNNEKTAEITTFEECVDFRSTYLGWRSLKESSLCECYTSDGRVFSKKVENVESLTTKYTDEEFGFSFYQPKELELSKSHEYLEGDIFLTFSSSFIVISKYQGERIESSRSKFGSVTYYFDEHTQKWIREANTDAPESQLPPVPIFYTTSGLSVFWGVGEYIVALSNDRFLVIRLGFESHNGSLVEPFIKTVAKTDQKIEGGELNKMLKEEVCALSRAN